MANNLDDFIRSLGSIKGDLRKEVRNAIKEAAKPLVKDIKADASWSTRIPRTVKISARTGSRGGVSIVAGHRTKTPHAILFEDVDGNGYFRHPVFGNRDVWVTQIARPFFMHNVRESGPEIVDDIGDALMKLARKNGWK